MSAITEVAQVHQQCHLLFQDLIRTQAVVNCAHLSEPVSVIAAQTSKCYSSLACVKTLGEYMPRMTTYICIAEQQQAHVNGPS